MLFRHNTVWTWNRQIEKMEIENNLILHVPISHSWFWQNQLCNSLCDQMYILCRFTRSYSNNLTFATVKVRTCIFKSQLTIQWGSFSCSVMLVWILLSDITWRRWILIHSSVYYYPHHRVVVILLRSTCQASVLLCLQGGFLVTPFDGVHSSSKFR